MSVKKLNVILAFAFVFLGLAIFSSPVSAGCGICDGNCVLDQEKFNNLDPTPYLCKKSEVWGLFMQEYFVAKGYDAGCCGGEAPEGGFCFECAGGCQLDAAKQASGDPDPYLCKRPGWFSGGDKYAPRHYDMGCCGGLPAIKKTIMPFLKIDILNKGEACKDRVKWEIERLSKPFEWEDVSSKCVEGNPEIQLGQGEGITISCTAPELVGYTKSKATWCGVTEDIPGYIVEGVGGGGGGGGTVLTPDDKSPDIRIFLPRSRIEDDTDYYEKDFPQPFTFLNVQAEDEEGGSMVSLGSLKVSIDNKYTYDTSNLKCEPKGRASVCSYGLKYKEEGGAKILDDDYAKKVLTDGKHVIYMEAADNAGNRASTSKNIFVGKKTPEPPQIEIVWPPEGKKYLSGGGGIEFSIKVTNAFDYSRTQFDWIIRDSSGIIIANEMKIGEGHWSFYQRLPSGKYTASVYAVDPISGKSNTATRSFEVENKYVIFFQQFGWERGFDEFSKFVDEITDSIKKNTPLASCPAKLEVIKSHLNYPKSSCDLKDQNFRDDFRNFVESQGKYYSTIVGLRSGSECCPEFCGYTNFLNGDMVFMFISETPLSIHILKAITTGTISGSESRSVLHELGHTWGLQEQYSYKTQKDLMAAYPNYPNVKFPNPFEKRLGCDMEGDCCNKGTDYCYGNNALDGSKTFMGEVDEIKRTAFDENEFNHLKNNVPIFQC